ncbi:MAG: FAD binding domain-containing protein [Flavobacteriales bacterium]|nr:FAD binding domain-containing protein [Flavobacteriales bacterium]
MIKEPLYLKPTTISEALEFADANKNQFRFLAGGTDVMVNKFQGNDLQNCYIDIIGIKELKEIKKTDSHLQIGSLVRLNELRNNEDIKNNFPVLIQAADVVASPVIRKTATIGGNLLVENRCIFYNQSEWWREAVGYCLKCDGDICIATGGKKNCFSKFVSDTAVALISMNATISVSEKEKKYEILLEDIYSGDGVTPLKFNKNSLIISVNVPLNCAFKSSFKKLRQRESLEFTSLTSAVTIDRNGNIKIVLGGVDPKPVVVCGSKLSDKNELIKEAIKKSRLVDNDVYSRKYRKEMIEVYLKRSFKELEI